MKGLASIAAALLMVLALPARVAQVTADGAPDPSTLPQCQGVSGGIVHAIRVPGMDGTATSVEPPPGFDPLNGSAAQLACYGFPPRPSDPRALQGWSQMVTHMRYVVPGFEGPLPTGAGTVVASYHTHWNTSAGDWPWSGYAISRYRNTGWTNLSWSQVQSEWLVPYGHTYCQSGSNGSVDMPWVGIGGDGWDNNGQTGGLMQGGTQTVDHYPTPNTYFFWEDWPNSGWEVNPPAVAQGDEVFVDVTYNGNGTATFIYDDVTASTGTNFTKGVSHVDLSAADFINEDQPASWDFLNFGTVPFYGSYAQGTWGNNYSISKYLSDTVNLSEFSTYKGTASNEGPLVSWPTSVDSSGDFTDYATANDGC